MKYERLDLAAQVLLLTGLGLASEQAFAWLFRIRFDLGGWILYGFFILANVAFVILVLRGFGYYYLFYTPPVEPAVTE